MALDGTSILDGQYPTTWDAYVGQEAAKEQLQITADSAHKRGDFLPHIMICSHVPGIGKTALGLLMVREYGEAVVPVSGAMKVGDALSVFEDMRDRQVLLYDEFHQIANGSKANQEWLLHYLENGTIMTPYGEEEVPRVSIIAMTTDPGMLLPTVRDRFTIIELEPYSDSQGADIAVHMSSKVLSPSDLPVIGPQTAARVARAGNNQPRQMRNLIVSIRDLATVGRITAPQDGEYDLERALTFAGLTEDGLTKEAQKYLLLMRKEMGRNPVGESLLKARLGYGRGNDLKTVEMLLVDKGLIAHTGRGRMLTAAGSSRAKQLEDL